MDKNEKHKRRTEALDDDLCNRDGTFKFPDSSKRKIKRLTENDLRMATLYCRIHTEAIEKISPKGEEE